ncbi:MAG: rhodanese-like domain-containing protein [Patescibacteria group bacterium]
MAENIVQKVQSKSAFLIDVRTENEWNAGHAKGAILFELSKIQEGETPAVSKDAEIYLYCHSGSRSGVAKEILKKEGFTNVENLGGLDDWQALGGELEE